MPYIIAKEGDGYKVCKKQEPKKCFSNKPLPKERAMKQRVAIIISQQRRKKNAK